MVMHQTLFSFAHTWVDPGFTKGYDHAGTIFSHPKDLHVITYRPKDGNEVERRLTDVVEDVPGCIGVAHNLRVEGPG